MNDLFKMDDWKNRDANSAADMAAPVREE